MMRTSAFLRALVPALSVLTTAWMLPVFGGEPETVPLWKDGAPGAQYVSGEEQVADRGETTRDRFIRNVKEPTLTAFLPDKEKSVGASVVICPGGGYSGLSFDKEGVEIARWLNGIGVAGFVLKYRLPAAMMDYPERHKIPIGDAQRAVRLVRSRAKERGVDPARIGVCGFSAGGHLAATAGTHFDSGQDDAQDPIERLGCRPDFLILVYPVVTFDPKYYHSGSCKNLLGENPDPKLVDYYSNEKQVTGNTPPAFLVHADDDKSVSPENSVLFYQALRKAGVSAEMHIYLKGGHGFGTRLDKGAAATWNERCADWLRARGLL